LKHGRIMVSPHERPDVGRSLRKIDNSSRQVIGI
jgi:hypothetical protein